MPQKQHSPANYPKKKGFSNDTVTTLDYLSQPVPPNTTNEWQSSDGSCL